MKGSWDKAVSLLLYTILIFCLGFFAGVGVAFEHYVKDTFDADSAETAEVHPHESGSHSGDTSAVGLRNHALSSD